MLRKAFNGVTGIGLALVILNGLFLFNGLGANYARDRLQGRVPLTDISWDTLKEFLMSLANLACGIGVLRRWKWAWVFTLVLGVFYSAYFLADGAFLLLPLPITILYYFLRPSVKVQFARHAPTR